MKNQSRRSFLKIAVRGGVGLAILPNIMPRSLFAADLPSRRIHVAQIGCGREGREDMRGVMAYPSGRIVAVCDLDSKRLAAGKKLAEITVPPFLPDTPDVRADLADYLAAIDVYDRHLAAMLDSLERAGELENTLVVTTSDNGMPP